MLTYIILSMYLQNTREPAGGFACLSVIVIIVIALVVSSNRKRKALAASTLSLGGRLTRRRSMSIYKVSGVGGDLEVFEDKLIITSKGVLGFLSGTKGTKTIPFTSFTGIQYKKPGLTNGYLQLTVPGGNESIRSENSFTFTAFQNAVMEEVKLYIECRLEELRNTSGRQAVTTSVADELLKLAKLKDQGLLTDEEFARAKERLLAT